MLIVCSILVMLTGVVVGECSEPVWKEAALQPAGSGASRADIGRAGACGGSESI